MTEQEFTDYMTRGDAWLDLLCFSSAVEDLLLAANEGRLTRAAFEADADAAARLADIRRQGGKLMTALAFLDSEPEQDTDA